MDTEKELGKPGDGEGNSGGDPLVTKAELKEEMKLMIQGLVEMNLIGPREVRELKLELIPMM